MSDDGMIPGLDKLEYVLSVDMNVMGLSFLGTLSKNTLKTFEACQTEVFLHTQARYIVVSFPVGFRLEKTGIPDLNVFFRRLRDRQRTFRICCTSDSARAFLKQSKELDAREVVPDMMAAMRDFQAMQKR